MAQNPNSEDTYVLPRNTRASARLTAQHYALVSRNGWLLHPTVAASLAGKDNVEIVDVATGNGIFAVQLADELPTATITGLDISTAQYPPAWTTPSNTRFGVWNFFDPVPDEYTRRFDVVHIRLIVGAVINKDKTPVIENVVKLLKPGGYLQWAEATSQILHRVQKPAPSAPRDQILTAIPSSMSRLQRLLDDRIGIFSAGSWFSEHLLEALSAVGGLTDTFRFDPPIRRSVLKLETDLGAWGQMELMESLRAKARDAVDDGLEREFDEAWRELARGLDEGDAWTYTVTVFVGRKPL